MRLPKTAFFLIIVAAIAVSVFIFNDEIKQLGQDGRQLAADNISSETLDRDIKNIQASIFTPEPLRLENPLIVHVKLNVTAIIKETNKQRQQDGKKNLAENARLNKAAQIKVADMFAKQYFEHESPSGEGPADLAKQANYDFIIIGENLALGNFESDAALVEAWMNSPGHRANILRAGYTEIGVAVARGTFENKTVWLAVQEFGTPATTCLKPSESLSETIESDQSEADRQNAILQEKKRELEASEPKSGPDYNRRVNEYNDLVNRYNALAEKLKAEVAEYNKIADNYNNCLQSYAQ